MGQALYTAQQGETDPAAKPLKGFGGAEVMEIVDRHDTNTYRAVYTVQFSGTIYVSFAKTSSQWVDDGRCSRARRGNASRLRIMGRGASRLGHIRTHYRKR